MPNWTPQQNNAINARGRNILVSAAAGSGKTAVLVERVIKKIKPIFRFGNIGFCLFYNLLSA